MSPLLLLMSCACRLKLLTFVCVKQTSSLDSHAQRKIFDTLDRISCSGGEGNGRKTKTIIFITHRLSTARRADKIAMMEHGVSLLASPYYSSCPLTFYLLVDLLTALLLSLSAEDHHRVRHSPGTPQSRRSLRVVVPSLRMIL